MKKFINMPSTNTKLKIAYLLDDTLDKTDGVQQYVLAVGEYMRSKGHEVHYLVADTSRSDLENVHNISKFVSLKFNGNSVRTPLPVSSKKIKNFLAKNKFDVVHVQMPYSPFFASKVIKQLPKSTKIVGTWHTFPAGRAQYLSHFLLALMIRKSLKKVKIAIGVSEPTAKYADRIYRTKSIVIPNAVNLAKFRSITPDSRFKTDRKKIVFLGRFDTRKGPKYLIQALAKARELGMNMQNIEVVMGGKGPDLLGCIELAKNFSLFGTITFPGFVDESEKSALLSSADICVFPSTGGEAFGISVVEAMASGHSVVLGGDNAGYRSILGEKPELLFDPKNTVQFATKLMEFANMPREEIDKYQLWLKKTADQYDSSVVCAKLLEIYLN